MFQSPHFIELLLFGTTIFFSIGYVILLFRIKEGWDKTMDWEIPNNFLPTTKVSIVIAARNEEKSIDKCLKSILKSNYPTKLYEIIVVNDHSEDETVSKVKTFESENVRLLNLDIGKGKKSALEAGIEVASGELIVCTDADCIVPKDWLMTIVSFFEHNHPKCIAAPIAYKYDGSLLQRFQYLDALNNMCVTANGIKKKSYFMANGANLIFTKSIFNEIGGYNEKQQYASGDDMFLIQKIAKRYPDAVSFLKSDKATVSTLPETSLVGFLNQRARWATKSKAYTNKNIMKIQGFVFSFVLLIFTNLLFGLLGSRISFFGLLIAVLLKLAIDYLYLSKMAVFFKDRTPLKSFFGTSLAFLIYILFAGWKAIWPSSYKWKGRITN